MIRFCFATLVLSLLLITCTQEPSLLGPFFVEIDKNMSENQKSLFKKINPDSMPFCYNDENDIFHIKFNESMMNKALNEYFNSIQFPSDRQHRLLFLKHAYQDRLNKKPFNHLKLIDQTKSDFITVEMKWVDFDKREERCADSLMIANDHNVNLGDTHTTGHF
jgi:hypothetical protein